MNSFSFEKSYLVVSYHYLRQTADKDPFPRVLGPDWETFRFHVSLIEQNFNIITLEQVLNFHEKKQDLPGGKPNMLFTFDDGLAEHHTAAQLLAERGIKGVFFIPTCLLREKVPINSSVIHYTIAKYGIGRFLEVYREGLNFHKLNQEKYALFFEKGTDNPWQKIAEINDRGIIIDNVLYPFLSLESFWIHAEERPAKIILKSLKTFSPYIIVHSPIQSMVFLSS
jgi:hypothetical protein